MGEVDCPDCGKEMIHVGKDLHGNEDGCAHWACDCNDQTTRNWPDGSDPEEPCPICKPEQFPCYIHEDEE